MRSMQRHRRRAESRMPLTVQIMQQGEGGKDPAGYPVEAEPEVVATTKGRLGEMSANEQVIAQQLTETVEGVLWIPTEVDVNSAQTLRVSYKEWSADFHIAGVGIGTPPHMAQQKIMVARQ